MDAILEILASPNAWVALLTLTFLEIILGIDNIVFISIVSNKLSEENQPKARNIGLILAMAFRIALLFGISWVLSLQTPLFHIDLSWFHGAVTGQSLIIFAGGLFLLYKSVSEIHHKLEQDEHDGVKMKKEPSLTNAITQIALLNVVFSFDSILTAIGLVSLEPLDQGGFGYVGGMFLMITAVIISVVIMMAFAGPVSKFVNENPSIQILGLSFLILIAVMLLAEASHMAHIDFFGQQVHSIPKGYLYFAIFFSLSVEFINLRMRKGKRNVRLKNAEILESQSRKSK